MSFGDDREKRLRKFFFEQEEKISADFFSAQYGF